MKINSLDNFLQMNPQIPQYSEKNKNYLIAGVNPIAYLDDGTQEEQIAPLSASIDWSNLNPVIIDSYAGAQNGGVNLYLGSTDYYGQSFISPRPVVVNNVNILLKYINGGGGGSNVTAYIYASTGSAGNYQPTGAPLATSTVVPALPIGSTYVQQNFVFPTPLLLQANVEYVLVISYPAGDVSDYLVVGTGIAGGADGNASYSSNGSSWTVDNTQNMIFSVNNGGAFSTILDGNVTHIIPSTTSTFSVYLITDTTHVYGMTTSAIYDLGYPSGFTSSGGGYLAIGGNNLFATYPNSGYVYYLPLSVTSAWGASASGGAFVSGKQYKITSVGTTDFTLIGASSNTVGVIFTATGSGSGSGTAVLSNWVKFGTVSTSVGIHIIEPFLDFIALRDGNGSFTNGGLVRVLDVSAFTISDPTSGGRGLNLGQGFGILQMRNYNDKYLAIAGGKTSSTSISLGYEQNYLFLWDGISSRYNYSMRIPGQFLDMKVVDSVLYVAVKVASGKTCLYELYNTTLRKVTTTQLANINTGSNVQSTPCSLFDYRNYVGVQLNTNNGMTNPLLIYGQDEMGNIEFIHSYGRTFDQIVVGYDGNLYASLYVPAGNSIMYYLPTAQIAGGIYQEILYKSQWIPTKNAKFLDIYHDAPPQRALDQINVTIDGQGEDIIAGSSTTNLPAITSTNYLTLKRTRLDLQGFTGQQIRITLSTVNTTWRPIIRAINLVTK